jgi:hypothetical protein
MCPCDQKFHAHHISAACETWQNVSDIVAQLQYIWGSFPVALIDYSGTLVVDNTINSEAVKYVKNSTSYGLSNFIITSRVLLEHQSRMEKLQSAGLNDDIFFKPELFNLNKSGIQQDVTGFRVPNHKFTYKNGLLYSLYHHDYQSKGKAFDEFIGYFNHKPSYVIMIDNNTYNLCAIAEACKAHDIPSYTILMNFTQ